MAPKQMSGCFKAPTVVHREEEVGEAGLRAVEDVHRGKSLEEPAPSAQEHKLKGTNVEVTGTPEDDFDEDDYGELPGTFLREADLESSSSDEESSYMVYPFPRCS